MKETVEKVITVEEFVKVSLDRYNDMMKELLMLREVIDDITTMGKYDPEHYQEKASGDYVYVEQSITPKTEEFLRKKLEDNNPEYFCKESLIETHADDYRNSLSINLPTFYRKHYEENPKDEE